MGNFDEFVPGNTKSGGNFDEFLSNAPVEKPESLLHKAASSIKQAAQQSFMPSGNPLTDSMNSTMNAISPGYNFMHKFKTNTINEQMPDNPIGAGIVDMATDPETWLGGKAVGEKAVSGVGKIFPYTSKEARVGFTKGVESSLINRRNALTRGYRSSLNKSKGMVDLSHIVDPGSDITQFTMKEAQDLKNAISQGIPEAVKKGVKIDPRHFQNREIAGMISDAMKKADPEIASAMEKYGQHAENFKSAIAPIKGAKGTENIFGSNLIKQMFGSGGSIPEKAQVALQEFAPRTAKEVHGAKVNQNIFRGLRGTAIGGAVNKFVPSIFKRALLSKETS